MLRFGNFYLINLVVFCFFVVRVEVIFKKIMLNELVVKSTAIFFILLMVRVICVVLGKNFCIELVRKYFVVFLISKRFILF